jgi:hypothetical protein
VILTLQEASQVWAHPKASHFLTLVSQVRCVFGEAAEDTVFRGKPGSDRLDNGNLMGQYVVSN